MSSQRLEELDSGFLRLRDEFRESNGKIFDPKKEPFSLQNLFNFSGNLALTGEFDFLDVLFLARFCKRQNNLSFFSELIQSSHAEHVLDLLETLPSAERPEPGPLTRLVFANRLRACNLADGNHPDAPFTDAACNYAWEIDDQALVALVAQSEFDPKLYLALARYRPELLDAALEQIKKQGGEGLRWHVWEKLIPVTDRYDARCLESVEACIQGVGNSPHNSSAFDTVRYFGVLCQLNELRSGVHLAKVLEYAVRRDISSSPAAVDVLVTHNPSEALKIVNDGLGPNIPFLGGEPYERLFALALANFTGDGRPLFHTILLKEYGGRTREACLQFLLEDPREEHLESIRNLILEQAAERSAKPLIDFWVEVSNYPNTLFLPEFGQFLVGKSKQLREAAASYLKGQNPAEALQRGDALLASNKVDERIGGITLLAKLDTPEAIKLLESAGTSEKSKQVRGILSELHPRFGIEVIPEPEKKPETADSLAEFEARIAKKPKSIKLPNAPWLSFEDLPPLYATDGTALAELTTTYVIQKQARGNKIALAPEIEPLVPFLDRVKNAPFAHAVLDMWFQNSDQKANTQWAVGLAGVIGNNSIIARLTENIEEWCERNRGGLAQWAVKGISLLGTDEALATLDKLGHKYRSRRKYVGAAAREAILTTARMRGMTLDDLEDLVVPTFDFDKEGRRAFEAKGGPVYAVLQPDFKLTWDNPATGKETKSPPGTLTDEAKAELKDVRKFLRESVKAQGLRLERLMVEQRRWPVARWRELFEEQPLLFTFAARLVWGIFDADNNLLRTFRRYPNGLLAHADGELEELTETDTQIGLIHPLELDQQAIEAWLAHLHRFKVKPPFRQLDRPLATLDPLHANRKEITIADGVKLNASTLRSRAEKLGWIQGATGDGGRIYCFYKPFPAGGLEVYLEVEDYAAFSTFEDEVTLGTALIARREPGERRSDMDEPGSPDDPRVLTFGEVPAIVYSESITDLQTIIAE